jgi:hypothetical protein
MVFNDKMDGFNRTTKQMDFVSRLTFVRGLKDVPAGQAIKERKKRKFKHWTMPLQADGYIKCRKHDHNFL